MMEEWFQLQSLDTKKTKIDGTANLLLYGYGSYGNSISPSFSSTRLSLINRDIIWVTAHIRGGMERGKIGRASCRERV